ncbi:hypothetical protein GL263_07150 [Streptomyces durbertensis]|uniref:Sporulation protein n=1 Tax=Streptomyces durbertensis TaxID=2448886 RepID=A0ABR6EDC3_9ACTN|nr:hypothetical protein [Streptomyces durbertensis]MBB1243340.1 hypothetical protein [Streptomyces durbertensis]
MADEVAGQPFPDGDEPVDRDHGAADDAFDSVVLDESFIRAAPVHEPSAAERMLAAAQSRAESEPPPEEAWGFGPTGRGLLGWPLARGGPEDDFEERFEDDAHREAAEHREYQNYRAYTEYRDGEDGPGYRPPLRWRRPVAWLLAVVMGVGVVAMAVGAAYRGGGQEGEDSVPPPATTEMDSGLRSPDSAEHVGAPDTGAVAVRR